MLQLKSKLDVTKLDYKTYKYFDGGEDIKMAARQSTMPALTSPFLEAVAEIVALRKLPVLYAGINIVPPGAQSGKHTDTLVIGYKVERWHLPLVTNKDAWIWLSRGGEINMVAGVWHGPFPYWEEHAVGNRGNEDRVHFFVDLDTNGKPISDDDVFAVAKSNAPPVSDLKPTGAAVVSKS